MPSPRVLPRHLVMTPSLFHLSFNMPSKTLADCDCYAGKNSHISTGAGGAYKQIKAYEK